MSHSTNIACDACASDYEQIESDKKHEELIAKWKRQLEVKARAFENLQKKFAPPKDLEQLRFKIQEELEGPHQQRVENLQDEIEKHREFAFNLRREYEIVKTEYEQFAIDQVRLNHKQPGSQWQSLHAMPVFSIRATKWNASMRRTK